MKYDHFSMLPERAFQPRNGQSSMTLEGGGGGGGHTTSTVTQQSIPDWLRPQTEAVLGAGMQEYFQTEFDPATGGYNIVGMKPYTPYSQDPRDYVAEFSPQQQQVFYEGAGLNTPGQFGMGTGMASIGAQGGIQSAGAAYGYGAQGAGYGGQGAFLGQQAAGMGGLYEQMATDPMSVQAYMSPYMQQVVEIQKQQAIEDAQRAQLGANLGAARQGTYGGARQTLAQAQREAALNKQLGDIQAQGLQTAFDQARQAQQFGVTTGLQGLQTGIQGAQTGISGAGMGLQGVQGAQAGYGMGIQGGQALGQLGTAQQQADLSRLGFQQELGAMQQAQQQQIIDQAIQNFAMQEEMPMQRLAGYNALLRGYATPTSTVSQYQAAPNALQSIGALGTAAGGFGSLVGGKKAGGVIKYAEGGITDVNALEGMAEDLSIPQLQQSMQNETLPKYVGMPILENKVNEAERMKMAQSMMGGQQQGGQSISDALMAKADQLQGITAVAEPIMAAGGGMVAFAGGDVVKGALNLSPDEIKKHIDALRKKGTDPRVIQAVKQNPSLLSRLPKTGLGLGALGVGMMATDALMSTDTGVGDEADVMFSGITPGSAGPRTARNALEAGQELFGALIPSGPGAETRAAQAELDAQREAQGAPAVSSIYPDEAQRGIKPGPTAATAAQSGAGKAKPKDEISAALDGITGDGQQDGMGQQQSLKDFADQYLRDRAAYAGEDVLAQKLKERSEKESSIFDRLSSAGAQIGLAGSMLRDPSRYGEYAQQAAGLRAAEAKARDEREMDYIRAMDRERQNKIAAFDKAEQRMSDEKKQSAQFRHEKAMNNARIAVQRLDVGARIQANKLSAAANKLASARKQYETSREYYTDTEFKIKNLAQKQVEEINSNVFDPEEKAQLLQGVRLQLAIELDDLYKRRMADIYPGMGFKNVTKKPEQ